MPVALCIPFPFPLFCSVRWYAYHACLCHSLDLCASLHTYLHVHAWVLLAGVLSMLQHNKAMDIRSKSTFVPRGHHLLFAQFLVCLFACRLAILLICLITCLFVSLLPCSPCLLCLSALYLFICSLHLFFPLLACCFLVFTFACTHMERGRLELGHSLPKAGKKGTDASMWLSQVAVFSRLRSLAFPFGYVLF